jgi:hypothetical protein
LGVDKIEWELIHGVDNFIGIAKDETFTLSKQRDESKRGK